MLSIYRCNSKVASTEQNERYLEMSSIDTSKNIDSNSSSLSPLLLNMETDESDSMQARPAKKSPTASAPASPKLFHSDILFNYNSEKFFLNRVKNLFKTNTVARNDNNLSESYNYLNVSLRQVKMIIVPFGIRILCTAFLWDHFVNKYHDLLEVYSDNPAQIVSLSSFKKTYFPYIIEVFLLC